MQLQALFSFINIIRFSNRLKLPAICMFEGLVPSRGRSDPAQSEIATTGYSGS